MGSRWLDGVISGYYDGSTRRTFFVTTPQGIAVVYPRVHGYHPDVRVGVFVAVQVSRPRTRGKSLEVEDMKLISHPEGIDRRVNLNELEILCQASLTKKEFGWFLFHNDFLGGMVKKRGSESDEEELNEAGTSYTVVCRRVRAEDHVPLAMKAFWVIEGMTTKNEMAKREDGEDKNEEKEREKNTNEVMETRRVKTTESIIPYMRKLLMDKEVCRLFAVHDEQTFERIKQICFRK
ncbi:hypothetical protein PMAYCL1PPCAC_18585 [Pristionchus mayeri]|uniref:Uncharacterized protein n=1 Tax=Pristionchus mayeri TaxID=1317129 RepID=A0AAN5I1S6_9BILA|nr:hypothetical protein PMAYCL1PPCAC_18585 [Pristionchus mayeri]